MELVPVVGSTTQPDHLSASAARKLVRDMASTSARVAVLPHAEKRQRQRRISFEDILRVLRSGTVTEGPYIATASGWWRLNMTGRSAGDDITCVVEIDWGRKLLVVTVF